MIIASYYTPGAYAAEADRLRKSLVALKIPHRIDKLPVHQQGWMQAVRAKPDMIIRQRGGGGLLFVDCDCVFHGDPRPILRQLPPCDIGVHVFRGAEVLSGTIYLPGNNPKTDELLAEWSAEDKARPDARRPQRVLQRVLEGGKYKVAQLPPELCWIFDLSKEHYGDRAPIIEHLQASREYRNPDSSSRLLSNRRKRIKCLS